jgi:multidrug resistance efflux pump
MKYGYDWWRVDRFIETTDDAYAGGNVTPISPHFAGFILEILVADSQRVAAGQLLIRLDLRDFRAALDHARALADERQATLTSLEAKYVLQTANGRPGRGGLAESFHADVGRRLPTVQGLRRSAFHYLRPGDCLDETMTPKGEFLAVAVASNE